MDFFLDNWIQTVIISLISGGFVGFITYLVRVNDQNILKKKLRTYIYVEINQLHNHINEVMLKQIDSKDDWFRMQVSTGIDLIFFRNEKVRESLIDLDEDETLAIVAFYRFYISMENKFSLYSRHLQEKMNMQKQGRPTEEIIAAQDLLIDCTNVLESDYKDLQNVFNEIKKSKEFQTVQKKYKLVSK